MGKHRTPAMVWQEASSEGKTYWYDDAAVDQASTTTWQRPTGPAFVGSTLDDHLSKGQPPPAPQPPAQQYPAQQPGHPQPMPNQPNYGNYGPPQGGAVVMLQTQQTTVIRYRMGGLAWCLVVLVFLLFWPLCWIPCVCQQCQEPYHVNLVPQNHRQDTGQLACQPLHQ